MIEFNSAPRKKDFHACAEGVRKKLVTVTDDLSGNVYIELFSGYLYSYQEKTDELKIRKYKIAALPGDKSIHEVEGYFDSGNLEPDVKFHISLSPGTFGGFSPIFSERLTSLRQNDELDEQSAELGFELHRFAPANDSLILTLCIAYHHHVKFDVPENIKVAEYPIGGFKLLLLTGLLPAPAIEHAFHTNPLPNIIIDIPSICTPTLPTQLAPIDAKNFSQFMQDLFQAHCINYCELVIELPHSAQDKKYASMLLASIPLADDGAELALGTPESSVANNATKFGPCIMCGNNRELTGEHLFAKWIGEGVDYANQHTVNTFQLSGRYSAKILQGNHKDQKLYVLCKECNNQWGSRLQQSAYKILGPLLKGCGWVPMTFDQRRNLARWLTCTVMVREFLHPELVTFSPADRLEFRNYSDSDPDPKIQRQNRGFLPGGLVLWMAPFSGSINQFKSRHTAFRWHLSPQGELFDSRMTFFAAGSFVFFSFGSNNDNLACEYELHHFRLQRFLQTKGFVRLWPCKRNRRAKCDVPEFPVISPPALTDEDVDELIPSALELLRS